MFLSEYRICDYARLSGRARSPLFQLLWMVIFIIGVPLSRAAAPSEYELKAVFLLNFARFVDWPEGMQLPPNRPLVIGVLGVDPFGSLLDSALAGETVNDHALVVKRLNRNDPISDCQILYISRSETSYVGAVLDRIKGRAILTVSDIDRFAYLGGMIGLAMDRGRIRVQINVAAAKSGQLAISAKLLRVSFVIRDQAQSIFSSAWKNLCSFQDRRSSKSLSREIPQASDSTGYYSIDARIQSLD